MLRPLILSATFLFAFATFLTAQPSQDEIAEARLAYINGDYEAALAVLLPAAEAGDANAQNIVADAYDEGSGVEQDTARAVEWWEKAAEQDFSRALHNLGLFYQVSDPEKARGYYERAAAQGNAGSMNDLGWMYESGAFGAPDHAQAVEYYRQASEGGNVVAMNNLGKLYVYSEGVDEDLGAAFDLFSAAALAGDPLGLSNLGSMYANGYAVRRNPVAAMALYRMAAMRGNAKAAIYLAYELIDSDSGLADPARGWAWCQVALERAGPDLEEFQEDCTYLSDMLDEAAMAEGAAMARTLMHR